MFSESLKLPSKLSTPRLQLERLKLEDAEEIFYAYASKAEATRFVSWPTHRSVEDTRAFLQYSVDSWKRGLEYLYGIRLTGPGKLIGSFGIINEKGKVQFGYIITPSCWGRGYATEVCQTMMSLLKNNKYVYRVGSFVDTENAASIRVLQKSGLVEEARLKKWFRFVNQNNTPKDCVLFYLPLDRDSG